MTTSHQGTTIAKWFARVLGGLVMAFWLMMIIGEAVAPSEEPWTWDSAMIVGSVIILCIGYALSYFNQKIGGTILLFAGILLSLFALFSAGSNHLFAALTSGGPFILTGILFLMTTKEDPL